jgi:hypothetical protein
MLVSISFRAGELGEQHGPFRRLRTVAGVLYFAEYSLFVSMPGRVNEAAIPSHEVAFLAYPQSAG